MSEQKRYTIPQAGRITTWFPPTDRAMAYLRAEQDRMIAKGDRVRIDRNPAGTKIALFR